MRGDPHNGTVGIRGTATALKGGERKEHGLFNLQKGKSSTSCK